MIDMTQPRKAVTGADVLTVSPEGQFFTFGSVILLKKKDCIVIAHAGPQAGQKLRLPLEFPATVDGVTYAVDLPDLAVTEVKAKKTRPNIAAGEKTKIQMCREIFAANATLDKAAMVAKFIDEAKCTPAGANTYFLTCMKG